MPQTFPLPQTSPPPHYPPPSTSLGSLAKGSWLAARLACFKYTHSPRHQQRPNLIKFICRKPEGSLLQTFPLPQTPPPPHYLPPRTTTFLAYERSVGFASIAIVVVCGRCVLHRLGSTTYKHPCLNSGRSISAILARPLPKVNFCC